MNGGANGWRSVCKNSPINRARFFPLGQRKHRKLTLRSELGKISLRVDYGLDRQTGQWLSPAQRAWGLGPHQTKGGLLEFGALEAVSALTSFGKDTAGRTRPDGKDDRSFPSQDSLKAFASARLSNRNLDSINISPWVRTSLKAGDLVLASGTAWSRIEGNRHYPSDVLVGAAIGNMVTIFIHDAFMNLPDGKESSFSFYIEPSPRQILGGVSFGF